MSDTLHRMQNQKGLREKLTAWDAKVDPKAPLTDSQKDGLMELTTLSTNRPLPLELPVDDVPSVNPKFVASTSAEDNLSQEFEKLNKTKVDNAQQFFLWYSEIEEKIDADEEQATRLFMEELEEHKAECDKILEEVSQSLSYLEELREKYVKVSTKTNALHDACEHLLAEQTKLVNTAESINNKLSFFNEIERISSKLGSPTLTVTNESFIPMLSRLDECIAYINKNPQYKESQVFMTRFRNCLSRALGLIRTHVTNILQNATQQVLPKKDITSASDDAFTLFYGKFRTNAPRVKSLMEQMEARVDKSPEYEQLLVDCHQCYFQQRLSLLGPSVSGAVTELAAKHVRDQCALMRSGCAFMVHVCEDEYKLFYNFFTCHTPLLDAMLESLCNYLYDIFRPLIIHVNHLETLAELCSILKIEMLEEHVTNNTQELAAFETVCSQMLEDVQERLVYRTHIFIRAEILNYNPAQGDLAYPDKLEMMESIAASLKQSGHSRNSSVASMTSLEVEQINTQAEEPPPDANKTVNGTVSNAESQSAKKELFVSVPLDTASNMPMSPADLHGMWYPTVRRTLVCLSKLYRCIDKSTFQGLSQETLSMCIQSLINASTAIAKSKTQLDAKLFLIKHLLILREQIAPFQVDFSVRETGLDFSKIKDAAYDLINSRARLLSLNSTNSLLQFLLDGTPQITETFLDSKKEVDNQLKKSCEDFIKDMTSQLVGPLEDFIKKANVIIKMREDPSAPKLSLRQQPFASPEKVHDLVSETYRTVKTKKAKIHKSMSLYLANRDTEYILFKPIKSNVQQAFQQTLSLLNEEYTEEDQQIIGCPSIEQINLLLSSSVVSSTKT